MLDTAQQREAMRLCTNTGEPAMGEEHEDVETESDVDGEEEGEVEEVEDEQL
jgi:hypothetical protein